MTIGDGTGYGQEVDKGKGQKEGKEKGTSKRAKGKRKKVGKSTVSELFREDDCGLEMSQRSKPHAVTVPRTS
jgi:hypothetical protein